MQKRYLRLTDFMAIFSIFPTIEIKFQSVFAAVFIPVFADNLITIYGQAGCNIPALSYRFFAHQKYKKSRSYRRDFVSFVTSFVIYLSRSDFLISCLYIAMMIDTAVSRSPIADPYAIFAKLYINQQGAPMSDTIRITFSLLSQSAPV